MGATRLLPKVRGESPSLNVPLQLAVSVACMMLLLLSIVWTGSDAGDAQWSAEGSTALPGACCDSVGVCRMTQGEEECTSSGGEWLGWGVICVPNPCTPPGACCMLDGSCRDVTPFWCDHIDGTFLGGMCEGGPCFPVEPGYCCIGELCYECAEIVCSDHGGIWRPSGIWEDPCIYPGCEDPSSFIAPAVDECGLSVLDRVLPNPTRGPVTVSIVLRNSAAVRLEVYDAAGRLVRRLLERDLPAGRHSVVWDPDQANDRPLPSGVYSLRLEASPTSARPVGKAAGPAITESRSIIFLK